MTSPQPIPTLQDVFKTYISECIHSKKLRSATIKSYEEVFATFQKIVPELHYPRDIQLHSMPLFFKRLQTRERLVGKILVRGGIKPSTIKTYYSKLIAFFRWMERYDYLEEGLCCKIIKPPTPVYDDEKALSDENVSKLMSAISLYNSDNLLGYQRDLLILSLGIYSGLRRQEILSLKIQDVNLEKRTLFVAKETSKSKKNRYVPLHPILANQIKEHFKERKLQKRSCEYLITSIRKDAPLTIYGLKHWVARYNKLSGVKFHIHQTRHTFACSLARVNADVTTIMKALGHSSLQMTQRYLRSITSEDSRSYIEQLSY